MSTYNFPFTTSSKSKLSTSRGRLISLLSQDLDFHAQQSAYASHNFHSFPAKFPPQLPRLFIDGLTVPGETVLDPMQGSGTTVLEAQLASRVGIGFDIDPLALLISKVKTTPLDPLTTLQTSKDIVRKAKAVYSDRTPRLLEQLNHRWDSETKDFIDYWFAFDTQAALMALLLEIDGITNIELRNFFYLALSAIIITKSGGVSLALDLAHTRPHRAKLIYSERGEILEGSEHLEKEVRNLRHATKFLRSPFVEFDKRVQNNVSGLINPKSINPLAKISFGNAEDLPLPDACVDLIVTSPPYAQNAIDYMRAHKFSLVWLGYPIKTLSEKRSECIGGELINDFSFVELPPYTKGIVSAITDLDAKKGLVLHRYYSEMTAVLKEMYRILKPDKSAIIVVGSSIMRGRDTETQNCLAEIGVALGFEVPHIGVRSLDRNRRMLPAGIKINQDSQIQQRMHEEYVIGMLKP